MGGGPVSPPAPLVLRSSGLRKSFTQGQRSVQALAGIDCQVRQGMVTGLVGPDGAGKTTLMRLATGLLVPDRGRIEVLGLDATSEFLAVQARVRYMPQRFGLYEDLTVQENLDLYADLQGIEPRERPERYQRLLVMTGLGPFTNRLAGRLSGGMKQKLGLACTLVSPPEFLILDEPTVGVDPVSRRELWSIVYQQVEEQGMSVLLSTAYLDEAERCQEVILMYAGRILGQGRPGEFSSRLTGQSFLVTSPHEERRLFLRRLRRDPEVLDAILLGGRVRLVTRQPMAPAEVQQRFSAPDRPVEAEPVAPRFEDAFIRLLRQETAGEDQKWGDQEWASPLSAKEVAGDGEVIVVRKLSRFFGEFCAVRELSFTVRRGEIFGLLGANGAGKTTTFRMLCGLLPPSSGELRVAGQDLRQAPAAARARIGYMAQKFSLYAGLTVLQNLRFFSSAYGLAGRRRQQRIDWALATFGLGAAAGRISGSLPLGFKQRLALAAALMHEPEILFLDEPTSGVDPLARRRFWRQINLLAASGVTVLVTTHFMEEAEYCDRLLIMAQGRILASGTPEELKAATRSKDHPEPTMEDAFLALVATSRPEAAA